MPSTVAALAALAAPTIRRSRRRGAAGLALGLVLAAAACGGGGDADDDAAAAGSATSAAAAAAAPAQPREFDACALAPEADVNAAVTKGGMAHTLARVSKPGSGGSCVYHSQDLAAKLLVEVNDFGTPDRAQQLMARHREMSAERKYPIRDVNGIGDQAQISDEGETSGFKARKGSVVVTANLGVTMSSQAQRHPAVEELGRKIIGQLP